MRADNLLGCDWARLIRFAASIIAIVTGVPSAAQSQQQNPNITVVATNHTQCLAPLRPLIIQVDFPDIPRNIDSTFVKRTFVEEPSHFINEMSYGKVCLAGEVTTKWYRMPRPVKDYWVPWQNLKVDRNNLRRLIADAVAAADKDIDVSTYDFVIISLAANFQQWGNHGVTAFPGILGWAEENVLATPRGKKIKRGIAVFATSARLGHVFHDIAHVIAGVKNGRRVLPCLYDHDLESKSTGNDFASVVQAFTAAQIHMGAWDPMSCNTCVQLRAAPGISVWTKLRLGWLDKSQVRIVQPGETAEVSLGALGDQQALLQAIRIPLTEATYYLIENRQPLGSDYNLPGSGVLISLADDRVAESRGGRAPVRLVNANPATPNLNGAAFNIGANDTFKDSINKIEVRLLRRSGQAYDIAVTRKR